MGFYMPKFMNNEFRKIVKYWQIQLNWFREA